MNEFILHSPKRGYHKRINVYPYNVFVDDVNQAYRFPKKWLAERRFRDLDDTMDDGVIIEVRVEVTRLQEHTVNTVYNMTETEYRDLLDYVRLIERLDVRETENLSNKEWKKFVNAKQQVMAYEALHDI